MRLKLLSTAAAVFALGLAGAMAQTGGGASGPSSGPAGGAAGGAPPANMSPGGAAAPGGAAPAGAAPSAQPRAPMASEAPIGRGSNVQDQKAGEGQKGTMPVAGQADQKGAPAAQGQAQQDKATPGQAKDSNTTGSTGARANLSGEQRTQVRTSFRSSNVRVLPRVDFSISVGTVVPTSVEYYEVPVEIVRVVPAWRGYRYIVVEDEIIIIEPETRRIVTVIERTG